MLYGPVDTDGSPCAIARAEMELVADVPDHFISTMDDDVIGSG